METKTVNIKKKTFRLLSINERKTHLFTKLIILVVIYLHF